MRRLFNIYGLYDADGKMVFKGNRNDIMTHYGIAKSSIYTYLRDKTKINGKYRVEVIGQDYFETNQDKEEEQTRKKEKPWSLDTPYAYLEHHLKYYGNTVCTFDPYPYLDDLKKVGLKCRVKEREEEPDDISTHKRGRKPKPKYYYILEVVNAERERKSV